MIRNCFIGIDPDLHNTAIAGVDEGGKLLFLKVASVPKNIKGSDAVPFMAYEVRRALRGLSLAFHTYGVVESQEIAYTARMGVNPRSIIPLAQVAGACVAELIPVRKEGAASVTVVSPQAWKGSVPKHIHQARTCKRMGWEFQTAGTGKNQYCVPIPASMNLGCQDVYYGNITRESDWKHLLDAIGLALWLRDKVEGRRK